jgi:cell division septation protein DedD
VLFALVNLGIPDALTSGPRTATQLAAACGCPNTEWLERVLDAAVAYRLLCRRPVQSRTGAAQSVGSATDAATSADAESGVDVGASSDQQQTRHHAAERKHSLPSSNPPHTTFSKHSASQTDPEGKGTGKLVSELGGQYEYYSNSLTACLRSDHPSSTAAMVKLNEYNYAVASQLTQVGLGAYQGALPRDS